MGEIWCILEHEQGILHEQSAELLHEACSIAHQQSRSSQVHAIVLSAPQAETPDLALLSTRDVDILDIVEHERLSYYMTDAYVDALVEMIQRHAPALVLTLATPNGRDYMPRLASQLNVPYLSSCLGVELQDNTLLALRSIYGGRAYAYTKTALQGQTVLVTLVPGVRGLPALKKGTEHKTRVVKHTLALAPADQHVRRIALQAPSVQEVELDEAERIVAGGRGIGQSGFATIASFAHSLGAAVGATRVATDQGWTEPARQIGATGKIVRPKLYIACGISGAAQHTSGMSESQTIIAINPDRSAPIFALADLGLLGDANQILPLATALLEETEEPETQSKQR